MQRSASDNERLSALAGSLPDGDRQFRILFQDSDDLVLAV